MEWDKIKLSISEFTNAFVIQILSQDMSYSNRVTKEGLVNFDGWRIECQNNPMLYPSEKKIFLRGRNRGGHYKLLIYEGEHNHAVLEEVLRAIKLWAKALDKKTLSEKGEKCYEISF